MFVTTVILAIALALLFLAAGIPKIASVPKARAQGEHVGIAPGPYRVVGALEALGAIGIVVGLWVSWLGVAAGIGLVLFMIGAVIAHVRIKDPVKETAPAVVVLVVTVAYVVFRLVSA